jgi:lysophospholipase L1-like esterase
MVARGPGQGKKVLVIGDSVTRDSRSMLTKALKSAGWNPVIRCFGGKRINWGISQLRDQRVWEGTPNTVVIALGTNDMRWVDRSTTKARINKILNRIGPTRNVLWVNLYGRNGDRFSKSKQKWFNKTIEKIASNRPNVHVLPWDKYAETAKIPMSSPLHYARKGLVLRTKLTVEYLNTAFGVDSSLR